MSMIAPMSKEIVNIFFHRLNSCRKTNIMPKPKKEPPKIQSKTTNNFKFISPSFDF